MNYKQFLTSQIMRMVIIFLAANLILLSNLVRFKSPIIGFIASIIYIFIGSALCGNIFCEDRRSWYKTVFGFAVLITLLSLGGSLALAFYKMSEIIITVLLFSIALALIAFNIRRYSFQSSTLDRETGRTADHFTLFSRQHILQLSYFTLVIACWLLLVISRSEEVKAVWDVIHPAFLPLCFITSFVLVAIIFSKTKMPVKLFFIVIHAFLIHSILLVVYNPGFPGDQWKELGLVRDIYNYGRNVQISIVDPLFGESSIFSAIYFSLRKRVYQSLVVIFANMFSVDITWSHLFLTPVFWTLVPFFVYEISKVLGARENSRILSAFLSISIPMFIWWGAYVVPDTVSIVFFCFFSFLLLRYMSSDRSYKVKAYSRYLVLLILLVSLLTHFKTGVICLALLFLAFVYKKYEVQKRKFPWATISLVVSLGISSLLLPLVLFGLYGVYPEAGGIHPKFDITILLNTDVWTLIFGDYMNYGLNELVVSGIVPILGILGLVYIILSDTEGKFNRSLIVFVLLAEVVFAADYRILKFLMRDVPMSPWRMWIFRDFLLFPFAAIFANFLVRKVQNVGVSSLAGLKTLTHRSRLFGFGSVTLILCLLFSAFFVASAENAYSTKPFLNPTNYEVDAIEFIDENTHGSYVVIGDQTFVYMAHNILGYYGSIGYYGSRAHYYTLGLFWQMYNSPNPKILEDKMNTTNSDIGFFVLNEDRYAGSNEAVKRAEQAFERYATFGSGKLHVFYYPPAETEKWIPVEISSGNYSRIDYPVEFDINSIEALPGWFGEHLDPNSVSVFSVNGTELPSQFDGFQAWFDNCSLSDYWFDEAGRSSLQSDGDVITFTVDFTEVFPDQPSKLKYTRFQESGGNLKIDSTRYKYIEIKLKENFLSTEHARVANIRITFWYEVEDRIETRFKWVWPTKEWSVFHYDYSLLNGTLYGLWIQIFDAETAGGWSGWYDLQIDWIRFISDEGTIRWLHSGNANTQTRYLIRYDSLEKLENTIYEARDCLPTKTYPNAISCEEKDTYYNFTRNWADRTVNFVLDKEPTEWISQPIGKTFSYVLEIDGQNILTSNLTNRGGLGIMQTSNSTDLTNISFIGSNLVKTGPIMAEVRYETNGYGDLHVQFYQGKYPKIHFCTKNAQLISASTELEYHWFISVDTSDDKVYYVTENDTLNEEDLSQSINQGSWSAQGIGLKETHGYTIVVGSNNHALGNYSARYNDFGFASLDFLSYASTSLSDVNICYVISRNASTQEIRNTIFDVRNPPRPDPWSTFLVALNVKVVDLLEQPLSGVSIEIEGELVGEFEEKTLEVRATTNEEGWAYVVVPQGTEHMNITASKQGCVDEKHIAVAFVNSATRHKLSFVKISSNVVLTAWQFVLLALLLPLGSVFLLLFLYRRASIGPIQAKKQARFG